MKKYLASEYRLRGTSGIFNEISSQPHPASLTSPAKRWLSATLVLVLASLSATSLLAQDVAITGGVDPSPATTPTWNVGGSLIIGNSANGTLSISGSGAVSNTFGLIGINSTSTATVSGGSWTNSGVLYVGNFGTGTLEISGGEVSNTVGYIATGISSTGIVTVSDGSWNNSGVLYVGRDGTGTLEISGGVVSNTAGLIGSSFGSTGTLNLNGGMLSTGQVSEGGGTGAVNFNGGTLQLTGDQANLFADFETGDVTLNAGGGTIETQAFTVATSQILGGTGSLTKEGTGTLTLTGANTYSGGTTLSAGTLVIGNDSALGTGTLTIEDGTILNQTSGLKTLANDVVINGDFTRNVGVGDSLDLNGNISLGSGTRQITNNGWTLRLDGAISGSGGLTLAGPNLFIMGGSTTNTYTGLTTVNGSNGLSLSKSAGTTAIAGDLLVSAGSSVSQQASNQIADTSAVTVNGDFTLENASETIGSLSGSGTFNNLIGTNTLGVGAGNFSGNITEDIPASLKLVKSTAGTLTLSGANTYSGGTEINGGTLLINSASGSGTGTVDVNNGGTLGGSGTLAGTVNVNSGGILAPGNSPGIITVGGDLNLSAGSITRMEINGTTPGTEHDQIVVGGTANLDGTLELLFGGGLAGGDSFTLIDAAAINGDFGSVVNVLNNALTFQTFITSDYILSISAVQSNFAPFALTPNQLAVANAIDDYALSGNITDLINFLNTLPGSSLPGAFDQIAPTPFAFLPSMAFADTRSQQRALSNHMTLRRSGSQGQSQSQASTSGDEVQKVMASSSGLIRTADENRWGLYTGGNFGRLDLNSDRNGAGYDSDSLGSSVGVDYRFSDSFILGFYMAYKENDLDIGGNGGDVQSDATTFGLYGTWFNEEDCWVEGSIGAGYHSYDTTRRVFGASATGDTTANEFQVRMSAGRDFTFGENGEWTLTPSFGLAYDHLRADGFTETGSLAPLAMDVQTHSSLQSQAELRLSYEHDWNGIQWLPYFSSGWRHEYLDRAYSVDSRFASGGGIFRVKGPSSPRDSITLGVGVNAILSELLSVGLGYNSEVNSSFSVHQIDASLNFKF